MLRKCFQVIALLLVFIATSFYFSVVMAADANTKVSTPTAKTPSPPPPATSAPTKSGPSATSTPQATQSKPAASVPRVVAAQVVWVQGTVQDVAPDNQTRELKRKDFVYEHDVIKTPAGASGQVVFSDSTLLALKENSEVKIDQYRFTQHAKPNQEKYVVSVVKGGFRTVTGAISKAGPNNYKVVTPVATIGVRGTEIVGTIGAPVGNSYPGTAFSVPTGAADFSNSAGTFTLDSTHQNANITSSTSKAAFTAQPAPGLSSVPGVQKVSPSSELIQSSSQTSTAALTTGPGGDSTGGSGTSSSGGSSGGSSGSSGESSSGSSSGGSQTVNSFCIGG